GARLRRAGRARSPARIVCAPAGLRRHDRVLQQLPPIQARSAPARTIRGARYQRRHHPVRLHEKFTHSSMLRTATPANMNGDFSRDSVARPQSAAVHKQECDTMFARSIRFRVLSIAVTLFAAMLLMPSAFARGGHHGGHHGGHSNWGISIGFSGPGYGVGYTSGRHGGYGYGYAGYSSYPYYSGYSGYSAYSYPSYGGGYYASYPTYYPSYRPVHRTTYRHHYRPVVRRVVHYENNYYDDDYYDRDHDRPSRRHGNRDGNRDRGYAA